jgi:hypothetical protein
MKGHRLALVALTVSLFSAAVWADDETPDDATAAAYAKLQAKQAAATRLASITEGELASLKAELTQLRAQVAQLTAINAELKKQLSEGDMATTKPVTPAAAAAVAVVPNSVAQPPNNSVQNPSNQPIAILGGYEQRSGEASFSMIFDNVVLSHPVPGVHQVHIDVGTQQHGEPGTRPADITIQICVEAGINAPYFLGDGNEKGFPVIMTLDNVSTNIHSRYSPGHSEAAIFHCIPADLERIGNAKSVSFQSGDIRIDLTPDQIAAFKTLADKVKGSG